MALGITPYRVDTREWFDTVQPGVFNSDLTLPPADEVYFYVAARFFSWWPIINTRGVSYDPALISDGLVAGLVGKQVNLQHDITKVIGSVWAVTRTSEGVEGIVQMSREQCLAQGLNLSQIAAGQFFSHVSVEQFPDVAASFMYLVDSDFHIVRRVPLEEAIASGWLRTTAKNPVLIDGLRCVEVPVPIHFSGIGFVPNPSDRYAEVYAMVASDDSPDLPATVPIEEQTMNEAEKAKLIADLAAVTAERDALAGQVSAKETASVDDRAKIVSLESQVADLTSKITTTAAEVASANETIKGYRVEELVNRLVAIRPAKDETELAALKETAAMACDDAGVVKQIELTRHNEALQEQVAALTAAQAEQANAAAGDAAAQAAAAQATADAAAQVEAARVAAEVAAAAAGAPAGEPVKEVASAEDPIFQIAADPHYTPLPMFAKTAGSALLTEFV